MEFNLQKTLNDNGDFDSYNGDDYSIDIFDSVTPGIGQIVPDDNFIVPLYNNSDLTTIMKIDNENSDQIGGGSEEISPDSEDVIESNNGDDEKVNENASTSKTNNMFENGHNVERKRKQMDPEIYQSFMHPKMFKTNTLIFDDETKTKDLKKVPEKQKLLGGKSTKHKFNVY